MAIGLTSEELLNTFAQSMQARSGQFVGMLQAIAAGENPEASQILASLQKQFPSTPVDEIRLGFSVVMGLMDTIVSNNTALAKTIPHVEP